MKSPLYTLLLCFITVIGFASCKRCKPDSTYYYTSQDAIPYELGSVMQMQNDSAVAIQFRDSIYSPSFTNNSNPSCECCDVNYYQFIEVILHSDSIDIKIIESSSGGAASSSTDQLQIFVAGVTFTVWITNGSLTAYYSTPFTAVPSLTVGSRTFSNVAKLDNNDYIGYPHAAHSIWYHPTGGLLKIQFYDGRVWELS